MNRFFTTAAAVVALIAVPSFGAAQSTSFADSLKAAEAQANQSEGLKECLKRTASDTFMADAGITDAMVANAPQYLRDTLDEASDRMAENLMEAVDLLGGDYVTAIEGVILAVVSEGTFGAETAIVMRNGLVACYETV